MSYFLKKFIQFHFSITNSNSIHSIFPEEKSSKITLAFNEKFILEMLQTFQILNDFFLIEI
jgi:hypothetical protein